MRQRLVLGVLLCLTAAGCDDNSTSRECSASSECVQGGVHGTCRPSVTGDKSWCSYQDLACPAPPAERWGAAAGDGLAGTCVAMGTVDGGMPDAPTFDAGPDAAIPDMSTKIIVASQNEDKLYIYSAETLETLATIPLPDRTGAGNSVVALAGDILWVNSTEDVTALDPETLTLRSGFPKHFDVPTTCVLSRAFFNTSGMYCPHASAMTATDVVQLWSGSPPSLAGHFNVTGPWKPGGSATRILVPHGSFYHTVVVLDATLAPVVGSPITAATTGTVDEVAASDELNRFAVAGGSITAGDIQLFDRTTLAPVGMKTVTAGINGMAFDVAHARVIAALKNGSLVAFSTTDATVAIAEKSVATTGITTPVIDAGRGRVYAVAGDKLLVLDATTLDHVAGSPVTLPAGGVGVTFY